MNTISLSEFTLACGEILNNVKKTGNPMIIIHNGKYIAEIHPPSIFEKQFRKLGSMKDSVKIIGDLVSPVSDEKDWEVLQD